MVGALVGVTVIPSSGVWCSVVSDNKIFVLNRQNVENMRILRDVWQTAELCDRVG